MNQTVAALADAHFIDQIGPAFIGPPLHVVSEEFAPVLASGRGAGLPVPAQNLIPDQRCVGLVQLFFGTRDARLR